MKSGLGTQRAHDLVLRISVAVWMALFPSAAPAQYSPPDDVLNVGLYQNPPKIFFDADGVATGFWPDVVAALSADLGFEYRFVFCEWPDCLDMLEAGELDMMPDVAFSEARETRVRFGTQPVLYSWSEMLVRSEDTLQSLQGIGGASIAVVEGSIQQDRARELVAAGDLPGGIFATASMEQTVRAVRSGAARVAVVNRYFARDALKEGDLRLLGQPFRVSRLFFAYAPETPESFVRAVDFNLYLMQSSTGSAFQNARRTWIDTAPNQLPAWLVPVLLGTVLIMSGLAITAFVLRRLVATRTDDLNLTVMKLQQSAQETEQARNVISSLQKTEALGRLVGGVAHDFNNLLAVIRGNLELLRLDIQGIEKRVEFDDAWQAVDRGASLTRQLLSFGRRAHLQPELIDLNEHLATTKLMLSRTLPETIEVRTVMSAGLWPTIVDPRQLDLALLNLAFNARDAMPGGGTLMLETQNVRLDDGYIEVRQEDIAPGRYVLVAISDTGHGMTEDVMSQAFEPFFTTKDVGQGSGMGLAMVFGFAKQSGGTARLYSEPDMGTTVKLYFPAANTLPEQAQLPAFDHAPAGRERVLLVEDEAAVRRTMRRLIEDLGYSVLDVSTGVDALELLATGTEIDVILTDIVMPGGVLGPDLAKQVRETDPTMPIVFMSGYPTEAAVQGSGLRIDDINLMKPVPRSELSLALRKAIARRG